ncbi:glycosyltransferase family A protein [Rhodanobacter sp. UC4436_H3]
MNKVSVVIPCYNAGEFLDEAVQSALAQTWQNLEVIIVDDGSTDPSTLRLLEEAPWPRTRIFHQQNAGPAAARNHAVREAGGSYILPLDADDTIEPRYVEEAAKVLDARPNVGCVYCKARKFGAEQGPWKLPAYTLRELVIDNVIFVTSLYRKADWESVGGYNEKLRHGVEDYDFWVKIVHLGRDVVQLDDDLFNYRIQASSRTSSFQDRRAKVVESYAEIFRSNIGFYTAHAEMLFEHRFGLYDELQYWRSRYHTVDAFLTRHPRISRFVCAVKGALSKYRHRKSR